MFKKTVVFLFLLSQVFASSNSPLKQEKESPKSHQMKLRARSVKSSPLGISELNLSSRSTNSKAKNTVLKPSNVDPYLDLDADDFDPFLDFEMDVPEQKVSVQPKSTPSVITEEEPVSEIMDEEEDFSGLESNLEFTSEALKEIFDRLSFDPSLLNAFNVIQVLDRMNSPHFESTVLFMLSSEQPEFLAALLVFTKDLVCDNQFQKVKRMYKLGVPMNKLVSGAYLTHYAALTGSFPLMSLFLDSVHIPVDALVPQTGESALQIALARKRYEMVIYLILNGARVGLADSASVAILSDDPILISTIIESNPEVLQRMTLPGGFNLLTYAIYCQSINVFEVLLSSEKINAFIPDTMGRTIFNMQIPESPLSEIFREKIVQEGKKITEFLTF